MHGFRDKVELIHCFSVVLLLAVRMDKFARGCTMFFFRARVRTSQVVEAVLLVFGILISLVFMLFMLLFLFSSAECS